jgi:hypothetical protein
MSRTDNLLNEFLNDWTHEGREVTEDIRARFRRLAVLAEQVIMAGGSKQIVDAYHDTVRLEMASGALVADRAAREAFNRTAVRAIRWLVIAVGA